MIIAVIVLLSVLIIFVGISGYFLWRSSFSCPPLPDFSEITNAISEVKGSVDAVMPATQERFRGLEGVFETRLSEIGRGSATIRERLGGVVSKIEEISHSQRGLESIFKTSQTRGSWAEMSLEAILSDILPPNVFGIRNRISGTEMIPDAHIKTGDVLICLDAKFPLDRFVDIVNEDLPDEERARAKKVFKKNVKQHLEKIRKDYIKEEYGTAPFAICYLPSENIYYYLVSEEFDLVREYAMKGVQVVSPLTLVGKLEMIKAGLSAQKMSEEILEVQRNIAALDTGLKKVLEVWKTLYGHHTQNLVKKSDEMNKVLVELGNTFERVK